MCIEQKILLNNQLIDFRYGITLEISKNSDIIKIPGRFSKKGTVHTFKKDPIRQQFEEIEPLSYYLPMIGVHSNFPSLAYNEPNLPLGSRHYDYIIDYPCQPHKIAFTENYLDLWGRTNGKWQVKAEFKTENSERIVDAMLLSTHKNIMLTLKGRKQDKFNDYTY